MLRKKVTALLKVHTEEVRMVTFVAALFLCIQAGQGIGEMAILDSAPRSATLRALNEVRVLSIDGDAFNTILLDRPEVAVSVLRNMSARVRELNEKVGTNG